MVTVRYEIARNQANCNTYNVRKFKTRELAEQFIQEQKKDAEAKGYRFQFAIGK